MEIILKELEKRYPSKKVLRAELAKIQKLLSDTERNEELDEYDMEVGYKMRVQCAVMILNSWEEDIPSPYRFVNDEEAIKRAEYLIDHWNQTLRPGDNKRILVSVYKIINLQKRVKIK